MNYGIEICCFELLKFITNTGREETMKTITKAIIGMCLLIIVWTNAWGETKVLTIYFCGTGMKENAYEADNSKFNRPELLASIFKNYDGSTEIDNEEYPIPFYGKWKPTLNTEPTGSHYKYIVNGAGTSPDKNWWDWFSDNLGKIDPDLGLRNWFMIQDEAMDALRLVHNIHPDDNIILNLIGFSRGGVATMKTARSASSSDYSYVMKINIIAFDPVPGEFDPVGDFGDDLKLSPKVNEYIGLYAEHERSYMFEPVIPDIESESTKVLMIRMPGSHETMVGNSQVWGGHNWFTYENSDYEKVSITSHVIVEQLLTSPEWGEVPIILETNIETKEDFSNLITDIWVHTYDEIPISSFTQFYGISDLCYEWLGRDHLLRNKTILPITDGRLCYIGGKRHESEWAWAGPCLYIYIYNHDQVYYLNDKVHRINAETWDTVQSFRGDPPPDTTPPEPNVAELPDMVSECSVSITQPPTATDDTVGTVIGTTSDPLSYTEQGTYTITWTYDDGKGNTSTQTQTVIVDDQTSPYPDLEELPAIVGQCLAEITDIPTAYDNCTGGIDGTTTDPLKYTTQGTYTITWTYDDGHGNITTQPQTVIVEDTEPPVIESVTADSYVLWPPNHKMVPVNIEVAATDNCDNSPDSIIVSVSSNEPENDLGDGNTDFDWEIIDELTAGLRAERSGKNKKDRVYTITIECVDNVGNSSISSVDVIVPHNKRQK